MSKQKAIILVVILILIVTVAAFARTVGKGRMKTANVPTAVTVPKTGAPAVSGSRNSAANKTAGETDEDVKAIESDLGSINDADFSEDNLSDQNVGL